VDFTITTAHSDKRVENLKQGQENGMEITRDEE
jgi:hypothetical protein